MKTGSTFQFRLGVGVGVTLLSLLAFSYQVPAGAQENSKASGENGKKMSMECPMITGLKGIKLTADSPPLLMARAEELNLTDEQQQQLKAIAQQAQRQATEVLTADQRSMLGETPGKAMPMMEIAMMRSMKMGEAESDMMCPMCKKKMEGMMKGKMMKNMKEPSRSSDTQ
ncbi:hypothetical protein K227x_13380 [Rubripirellula lacrimiformis]|uniref:Uncharacterized protein n=1 Tax=Rubripirellula lacrimiformis TaxID=1930273 RepID=A0A517N730_9BACT|nr:hypothetical protein [Rubripirellula lacrimiformis]QDT02959.1 hypothetical protein K227x_13380 [Rubripirellula lacrimiformis]